MALKRASVWVVALTLGCSEGSPASGTGNGQPSGPEGLGLGGSGLGGASGTATPLATAPKAPETRCALPPLPSIPASPATVVGTGTAASCTVVALRAALAQRGKITFDCGAEPAVIAVDEPLLVKDKTWLAGAGLVTLDGGDRGSILWTENKATVILEGLAFQNGHARSVSGQYYAKGSGGAILRGFEGNLTVRDCQFLKNVAEGTEGFGGGAIGTRGAGWTTIVGSSFANNSAPLGGAVYSLLSDLTIIDSVFQGNSATTGDGGAVFTDGAYIPSGAANGSAGGQIQLCGSRFLENTAVASSGAGFLYTYGQDRLTVDRCEFRGNSATKAKAGRGAAINIYAIAEVKNSLFTANRAAGWGGAVWMGRGPGTFENDTFFDNQAALYGGALSYGAVEVTLRNCTVAYNTAETLGDAFYGDAKKATLNNSLVVDRATNLRPKSHCSSELQGVHSLVFPTVAGDLCGAGFLQGDPLLANTLAALGGPTPTLALGKGSPAIDAGVDCPSTDQRGLARDTKVCDLGAYEAGP